MGERSKRRSRLSYDFQKYRRPARKDQSHRYSRFRVVPHLASRGTEEKKGGSIWRRSKDERRSIPGGGVSALGVLSKDIYADEVTSTISHCLDLPQHCGVFCTYGSVGWVCTRHHFIPLRHGDRVFACPPRFREFLRVCRTNWILFSDPSQC